MGAEYDKLRFDDTILSDEEFNRRWRLIDTRFQALEGVQLDYLRDADILRSIALSRINDALAPVLAFTGVGDLLRCSATTSLAIETGTKTFVVDADDRSVFAAPLFVIAAVQGTSDQWMAGQVTSWNNDTGELVVDITNSKGAGTYSAWDISVASIPPDLPPAQTAANVNLDAVAGMTATDVQGGVEELQTAKAPLASPALTGTPTAPTAAGGTNTTQLATTAFVKAEIDTLVAAAPGALDTLNELAAALGDDANFSATMTTALAGKQAASANLDAWSALATSAKQDAMTLATQAQAQAGTDNATWMSPLRTAEAIAALAASGSWTLINETIISGSPSYIDFAGTWDYPILEVEYVGVGGSYTARERLWLSDDDGTSWASFSTTGIAGDASGAATSSLSSDGLAGASYYNDVTGTVRIFRANETAIKPIIIGPLFYDDPCWVFGRANTSASLGSINRIRCSRYNQGGSRTYSRGTIRLWGIK